MIPYPFKLLYQFSSTAAFPHMLMYFLTSCSLLVHCSSHFKTTSIFSSNYLSLYLESLWLILSGNIFFIYLSYVSKWSRGWLRQPLMGVSLQLWSHFSMTHRTWYSNCVALTNPLDQNLGVTSVPYFSNTIFSEIGKFLLSKVVISDPKAAWCRFWSSASRGVSFSASQWLSFPQCARAYLTIGSLEGKTI